MNLMKMYQRFKSSKVSIALRNALLIRPIAFTMPIYDKASVSDFFFYDCRDGNDTKFTVTNFSSQLFSSSNITEKIKLMIFSDEGDLIFSIDGKRTINLKTLNKYFRAMLEEAEIADVAGRGIVLYSLRHFMITQRIMAGLNYRQVADMCGTSVTMIEKTYWHLNDEIRLTSALADYRRREDGTIEVI